MLNIIKNADLGCIRLRISRINALESVYYTALMSLLKFRVQHYGGYQALTSQKKSFIGS